jgi:hypothetical protein
MYYYLALYNRKMKKATVKQAAVRIVYLRNIDSGSLAVVGRRLLVVK